jgi:hypothetical protein
VAGVGFAAPLPLQERLLALTPQAARGQVQGVESAGRIAWQGVGAALAGALAQLVEVRWAIGALAALSLLVTVVSRPAVVREGAAAVRPGAAGTVAAGTVAAGGV